MAKQTIVAPNVSCGAKPTVSEYTYKITTLDAQRWLQKKIDSLVAMNNERYDADVAKGVQPSARKLGNIKVQLDSIIASPSFAPFVITLNSDAVKRRDRKPREAKDNEIPVMSEAYLARENGGDHLELHPAIHKLLSSFRYSRAKERRRQDVRTVMEAPIESYINNAYSAFKVGKNRMVNLMQLAQPYELKVSSGKVVMMLISPVLLFHAMLASSDNESEIYKLLITDFDPVTESNLRFTLKRITHHGMENQSASSAEILKLVKDQISRSGGRQHGKDNRRNDN